MGKRLFVAQLAIKVPPALQEIMAKLVACE
jgi:hypothetical protein